MAVFWAHCFLTEALLDLLEQEPHLELQISPLSEEDIFTCLLAGELDMGLSIYPPWPGFHSQALPPLPWVLAGVPNLCESSDPFPYFVLNSEEWPGRFHVDLNLIPQPARCVGHTNSFSMMRSLLLSGIGGGFILKPYVQEDVAAGRLVIIDTPSLPSIIPYAVWLKDISHSTWMRPLLDCLVLEMNNESL